MAEVIEADQIKLENVKAGTVRGKVVNLVSQCNIGKLEFSEDYRRGSECTIKEVEKVD